ncbi:MAG: Hpt domain-containing protein, partial [Planctomycetes bacterium]|nr:Hpt domain-containing protein [Planctomycetota bacterium]
MKLDLSQYRNTFFGEVRDHLAALEAALLRLDAGEADGAAIDDAFRAAHSIKGGADAVGLSHVAKWTHALEGALQRLRGADRVPRAALDGLLEATDAVTRLVDAARAGDEPPDVADVFARLAEFGAAAPEPRRAYAVTILPHPEAMRNGLDPLALLRGLAELGTVARVEPAAALPPLADLDPERCYLSWTVHIQTDRPAAALADVFAFAPDMVRATVVPTGEPVEPPPAPAEPGAGAAPVEPPPDEPAELKESSIARLERGLPVPDPVRFASFLVARGAVTAEQALDALNRQRDARPMIGCVAVQAGLMTVDRLFAVLGQMNPNEGFCAAALRLDHLTGADLGGLLVRQEQSTPPLGDCLLAGGALTPDVLERELAAYRSHAAASSSPDVSYTEVPAVHLPPAPGASLLDENGAMMPDFCAEADEHLEAVDRHLLTIDGNPTDAEALNAVYRAFHSVKGVSSMLGLVAIQTLAHEAENLLNLAREGKVLLRGKALDLVFASTDALKRQVRAVRRWTSERGRLEEDPGLPKLLAELRAAVGGPPPPRP